MAEGFAVASNSDTCPQCDSVVLLQAPRCGVCGFTMAGQSGRTGPFSRITLLFTLIGFAAVYLGTLAVVAITR